MSEAAPEAPAAAADAPAQEQPAAKPETDWKAEAKKWETRAKENKTAADRLASLEESQKTEAQKLADRATAAEDRASKAERSAMRLQVITESGLPSNLHRFVVGTSEDELRDAATALKAELAASLSPDNRAVDVGLGPRGTAPVNDMNALLRRGTGRG